jgi:hypothetical protein
MNERRNEVTLRQREDTVIPLSELEVGQVGMISDKNDPLDGHLVLRHALGVLDFHNMATEVTVGRDLDPEVNVLLMETGNSITIRMENR